jgi:SSS family solute:Na+ symporter
VLTIPERLAQTYDNKTALIGSIIIFLMTVPAAYVLMLGVLCEVLFGWPFWLSVTLGTLFSIIYVYLGGFNSVVRTDLFQFGLMFLGFAVFLIVLVTTYGGTGFLKTHLPPDHLSWHGGNSGWYIAIWYVIALATLVEPAFFQRCYAARTAQVARSGIFISIGFWALFDFLTTSCGLYARAILPELADPVASYPALAQVVLPAGLLGLFALSLLATVMSTVDSYSFLAASTFGNDIMRRTGLIREKEITAYTRFGLVLSTLLAVILAVFFRSAVDIWHAFGSIGTPALLVPVFFSFVGRRRMTGRGACTTITAAGMVSLVWYQSKFLPGQESYWLAVEPIFPGMSMSLILFFYFSRRTTG